MGLSRLPLFLSVLVLLAASTSAGRAYSEEKLTPPSAHIISQITKHIGRAHRAVARRAALSNQYVQRVRAAMAARRKFWSNFGKRIGRAKRNSHSAVYKNQHKRESLEAGFPAVLMGGQTHDELLLIMSGVDRLISRGSKPDWDKFSPHHLPYFLALKKRMQLMFFSDECAPFFDGATQRWTTCCMLHFKDSDVGFCGSNLALGLPVPCRKPVATQDYGVLGKYKGARAETPNSANKNMWRCRASSSRPKPIPWWKRPKQRPHRLSEALNKLKRLKRSTSRLANSFWTGRSTRLFAPAWINGRGSLFRGISQRGVRSHNSNASNRPHSSRHRSNSRSSHDFRIVSTRVSDELTIEIYPAVTVSANLCRDNYAAAACYLACCDSLYSTSPFCSHHGMQCY